MNKENCYKKLNQTQEDPKVNKGTIETFQRQQVLLKNNCGNLKTTKVRTPHFYTKLEVHKKIYLEASCKF